jgi:ketosteroid isomerase-like protein
MSDGLREVYRTIDACDWPALEALLHPEVVYERPGYDPLVGRERVMRFYREERIVASGRHEIIGIVREDGVAACWGHMRGTLRDGSAAEVQFADVYSLDAGQVRTRRSYFFTPAV